MFADVAGDLARAVAEPAAGVLPLLLVVVVGGEAFFALRSRLRDWSRPCWEPSCLRMPKGELRLEEFDRLPVGLDRHEGPFEVGAGRDSLRGALPGKASAAMGAKAGEGTGA